MVGASRAWLPLLVFAGTVLSVLCTVQSNQDDQRERYERLGYRILPGVAPMDLVDHARQVLNVAHQQGLAIPMPGPKSGQISTTRVFNPIALDPMFGRFLELIPAELDSHLKEILGPWFVGSFHAHTAWPTTQAIEVKRVENLHVDYPFGSHAFGVHDAAGVSRHSVNPSYPKTVQILVMLDNFTERSGGTRIVPGSHKESSGPDSDDQGNLTRFLDEGIVIEGRAGDMLMYSGQLWHANGANTGTVSRHALLIQCLPFYVRPMESHARTLPIGIIRRLSPVLRQRLGITPEFGFAFDAPFVFPPMSTVDFIRDVLQFGEFNATAVATTYLYGLLVALALLTISPLPYFRLPWKVAVAFLSTLLVGLVAGIWFGITIMRERTGI